MVHVCPWFTGRSRRSRLFLHLFEDSLIPDGFGHVHVLREKPFKPHHPTIGFKAELWHQNTSTIIDDLLFSALVLLAHLRASGNTIIHWICIGLTDSAYSWLLVLISSSSNPMPSLFWLVVLTILKNIKVNRKDDIPYMKWKIKNVPIHQPVLEYLQPFLVGEFPFLSISAR